MKAIYARRMVIFASAILIVITGCVLLYLQMNKANIHEPTTRVTAIMLNCRSEANATAPIVIQLKQGDQVRVMTSVSKDEGRGWVGIKTKDGVDCVVKGDWLEDPYAGIPINPDVGNGDYMSERNRLLAMGFKPKIMPGSENAAIGGGYWRACPKDELDCSVEEVTLPEIESCSGTGQGRCAAYWLSPRGETLRVITAGEPQPGGVVIVGWTE